MAIEIERKFLVDLSLLGELSGGTPIKQGYIQHSQGTTVRVRIKGDQGFLTLKSASRGLSRLEFEYPIPLADADEMLASLCSDRHIEKTRYVIPFGKHLWELDLFSGANEGLVIAEVELTSEKECIELPAWVTEEVSGDPRYANSSLVDRPFNTWQQPPD